ncbi:hypothetical protein [Tropicimonas sp. IMCC6043]|uniref:hypothetical protein n=1 Tax=Tropicimonas sp. IMCC6043 TaxID=2510645 RepID=UPI00101DE49E|nr:hypothetical protein [Tropicimonas sp. IMCC6043]RYH10911.1 hypothetical protein EU800_06570 [Tropicimonas sp. IMCC6043]
MNGETVLAEWQADRSTYIQDHVIIAVIGAVICSAVLIWVGNSSFWVAFVAAPLAVAVRGVYLASEELTQTWVLTNDTLTSSNGKRIPLVQVKSVNRLGSAVQLVTHAGDKHLMKYLPDPKSVRTRIEAACNIERGER